MKFHFSQKWIHFIGMVKNERSIETEKYIQYCGGIIIICPTTMHWISKQTETDKQTEKQNEKIQRCVKESRPKRI